MTRWQRIKYEWRIFSVFMTLSVLTEKEREFLVRRFDNEQT